MIRDLIRLARPHQYTKNLFIFLPAFFAFQLAQPETLVSASLAFLAFSLVASAVYVLNDWVDRYDDAQHPEKSHRPIASGQIKTKTAFIFLSLLMIVGGGLAYQLSFEVFSLLLTYLVLNLAYSLKLKHLAIIDVVIISSGFVIRLFVGAAATSVTLSHWIIVMTFLLALFLSLAKRRDDVLIYLRTDRKMRKVVDGYNLKFLDSAMMMTASITILAYILWSISPDVAQRLGTENLYLSAVFVILGVLRYMQIAFVEEKSGNPTKVLLRDHFIQLTLVGWIGVFIWMLYIS